MSRPAYWIPLSNTINVMPSCVLVNVDIAKWKRSWAIISHIEHLLLFQLSREEIITKYYYYLYIVFVFGKNKRLSFQQTNQCRQGLTVSESLPSSRNALRKQKTHAPCAVYFLRQSHEWINAIVIHEDNSTCTFRTSCNFRHFLKTAAIHNASKP